MSSGDDLWRLRDIDPRRLVAVLRYRGLEAEARHEEINWRLARFGAAAQSVIADLNDLDDMAREISPGSNTSPTSENVLPGDDSRQLGGTVDAHPLLDLVLEAVLSIASIRLDEGAGIPRTSDAPWSMSQASEGSMSL